MPAASTIYLALAGDADFSEHYARAREAQLIRWEDELIEIADDAKNDYTTRKRGDDDVEAVDHDHIARSKVRIDTRKWLMAKRAPKKYGDRIEHEVNATINDISAEPLSDTEWAEQHATTH